MDDRELAIKALRVLGFEQVESWGEKGVQFVEFDAATERMSCWAYPIPTSWALAGLVLERLVVLGKAPTLEWDEEMGQWTLNYLGNVDCRWDPCGPRAVLLGALTMAGEEAS